MYIYVATYLWVCILYPFICGLFAENVCRLSASNCLSVRTRLNLTNTIMIVGFDYSDNVNVIQGS